MRLVRGDKGGCLVVRVLLFFVAHGARVDGVRMSKQSHNMLLLMWVRTNC